MVISTGLKEIYVGINRKRPDNIVELFPQNEVASDNVADISPALRSRRRRDRLVVAGATITGLALGAALMKPLVERSLFSDTPVAETDPATLIDENCEGEQTVLFSQGTGDTVSRVYLEISGADYSNDSETSLGRILMADIRDQVPALWHEAGETVPVTVPESCEFGQ